MLHFYRLDESKSIVKEWYNGYRFGDAKVYNPWSVINYVDSAIISKNIIEGIRYVQRNGDCMRCSVSALAYRFTGKEG